MVRSLIASGCAVLVSLASVQCAAADGLAVAVVQGWAAVADAAGGGATTGGQGGATIRVHDEQGLLKALSGSQPQVILIEGMIELSQPVRVPSEVTLQGVGIKSGFRGNGLHLRKVSNIVLRNLSISEAADAIGIEESHHIWVDHCSLSKCRDGLLDIKRGSDFITVSWNHFFDHHKSCLLGHSDKPGIREIDRGHLRVTYHHNFFDGTKTRHPRVRFAEGVHVVNNYYRGNEYGVAALMDSGVIVDGNVFEDVEHPTLTEYGDSPDPGRLVASGNLLIDSGEIISRGSVDRAVLQYQLEVEDAERIRVIVPAGAGVQETQDEL